MLKIEEDLDPCLVGAAVISNNQIIMQCLVAGVYVSLKNKLCGI